MPATKSILAPVLFAGTVFFGVQRLSANPGDTKHSIIADGRERTFQLHVPSSYDGSVPVSLVLALHGRLGNGEGQERLSHFDKGSDEHGFIVVYPDGLDRSWADGRGATPSDKNGVNDVTFLSELIGRVEREYKIDRSRVYATGFSNGGFMSARLACDLADKIVAIGIVAASLSTSTAASCKPSKPVSVLIMQGTKDPLVPFAGGPVGEKRDHGVTLSHEASVEKFAQLNRCSASPQRKQLPDTANDGTAIGVVVYSACASGTEVRGYTIEG